MREDDKMRWENILNGIDEKYVGESAEFLAKSADKGEVSGDYYDLGEPDMVIPPQPVKKSRFTARTFAACAAVAAVAVAVPFAWGALRSAPDIIDDGAASSISGEGTSEADAKITLHTSEDFQGRYTGSYQPFYDTTDPIEAAEKFVTEMNDASYVSNFEIKDAYIYDRAVAHTTESLKQYVHTEGSIPFSYGWTEDMVDRGIFTVVRVDYYANFDHTQTPTDFEGDCYVNVFMVRYEDTGWWQIYDHGYTIYDEGDVSMGSGREWFDSWDRPEPGTQEWLESNIITKFVSENAKDHFTVVFPDKNREFDERRRVEIYGTEVYTAEFGFAFLLDLNTGEMTKVYNPLLHASTDVYRDLKVINAGCVIHHGEGLYMNTVTLEGNFTFTVSPQFVGESAVGFGRDGADIVTFTLKDGHSLPSLDPYDHPDSFCCLISPNDENYDMFAAYAESGKDITFSAKRVTISYEGYLSKAGNSLKFEGVTEK